MNASILIIEPDPHTARAVQFTLDQHGHHASIAPNGHSGLRLAAEQHPDLIILDADLPDLSGTEVIKQLKSTTSTPIVVLSADDRPHRKADLLDAGADDCLTALCDHGELLARIRARLRHTARIDQLTVGELVLSPDEHRAWFGGTELHLSRVEEQLLLILARQPGRVFKRDELSAELWGDEPREQTTLDTHVTNLRAKLRVAGGHGLIRTARGVGFGLLPVAARRDPLKT